eukprot:TRINITY_DN44512_c0_g1_i1.p1 TRINITY_DN44512_c0_g1~~TRINITY_DN44512_c0_g1_i1.p1  ORF type:complete len:952 (+),score=244.75 TRINITY_DN44512_c0_g1_i1:90-2945(+)
MAPKRKNDDVAKKATETESAAKKRKGKEKEAPKIQPTAEPKAEPKAAQKAQPKAQPEAEPASEQKIEVVTTDGNEMEIEKETTSEGKDGSGASEQERDAPSDQRAKLKDRIVFHHTESTLNVVTAAEGRVLMTHSDGGMQYLVAASRANVGVKAGRYFYEVRVLESLNPAENPSGNRTRGPINRQMVRVGFSVEGSSLIFGDGDPGGFCFDTEGFFSTSERRRFQASKKLSRDQVIGVLLNLDPKSPNANTVSIFLNGERASEPQALPEDMKGKALFPHVAYRNVTLQVNFGSEPLKPLPFKCNMLQMAAISDVSLVKHEHPKDGKYEVLFPVGFPDEGTFDWLDAFLQKNPQYVELSDRKIIDWAIKSGLWKSKTNSWKTSRDKPDFNFGLQLMDDFSVRRVINAIASVVPRNYVVMEVKQNLVASDRANNLKRFPSAYFKRVARVAMGEPANEFKQLVRSRLLKQKQEKSNNDWHAKKQERERQKLIEKRKKELAEKHRQAAEEAKRKAEEAKKKEEEAKKKAEEAKRKAEEADVEMTETEANEKKSDEEEEPKDGKTEQLDKHEEDCTGEEKEQSEGELGEKGKADTLAEAKADVAEVAKEGGEAETKEEANGGSKDVDMEDEEDADPPVVTLTEEEEKEWFSPSTPGLSDLTPHVLDKFFGSFSIPETSEGFDEVKFEWEDVENSKQVLRKWILERKRVTKVEDLVPGEWFRQRQSEWARAVQDWQAKQKEAKLKAAATKGADDEEDVPVDMFAVEDVCDIGNGEPLFFNFGFEDWTLLSLRWELHAMAYAFQKDAHDEDRTHVPEAHIGFYFMKYFQRQLTPRLFGKDAMADVISLMKNTLSLKDDALCSMIPEDAKPDIFVKLTEESRRDRQLRIDAGDETARLKLAPSLHQLPSHAQPSLPKFPGGARVVIPPLAFEGKGVGKKQGKWSGAKVIYAPKAVPPAS